jgi:A/G-specific adenine glycosylase
MLDFSKSILKWFDQHGRKNLPWQENKTPYRVWVSEIMLQQTQVTTVIPYFKKFMQQFPDVSALANATEDTVLHLWTGLGYYTRARNLHKTAKIIHENFSGIFPDDIYDLEKLPGIGLSTAGAIVSIAFKKPATILDGNVKRVLTRYHGIKEWPGEKNTLEQLWKIAESYTPSKRADDYSQAIMDLGATICIRGKPLCNVCPLKKTCVALEKNIAKELPASKPKKILAVRKATILFIQKNASVLLEKRPPIGIWGGLWCPPQISEHVSEKQIKDFCFERFSFRPTDIKLGNEFRHTFSHFHLDILPVNISLSFTKSKIMDSEQQIWYNLTDSQTVGLPAPVKKIIEMLK